MRTLHPARIAAGDTKSEIKDKLVAEYGPADPRRAAGAAASTSSPGAADRRASLAGAVALGFLAWRWSRGAASRPTSPRPEPDSSR